jgi:ketosteroid isomerase-like protein
MANTDTHALVDRFLQSLEARDWKAFAALLDANLVYELPQSHERIRGRDTYVRFNAEFPGDWHLVPRVVIADEDNGVAWFDWTVGTDTGDGIAFFRFASGLINGITDFWPDPYDPPPGREHLVERW